MDRLSRSAAGHPDLPRESRRSIHVLDCLPGATVQSRLDEIGFGRYHWLLLAGVGGALMSESMEMGSVAPMHTALARVYGLSHYQRSLLPAATFAGSGIGLFIAGPVCDWQGRKFVLVASLVIIAASMIATALLPLGTPPELLYLLRFVSGLAGAIQVPAGLVLAVESCPSAERSKLVFGVQMLGCMGYLLEAVLLQYMMPHFGEELGDHWRSFCFLLGASALAALPLALALYESPSLLGVQGNAEGCVEVLQGIAKANGVPLMPEPDRLEESLSSSSVMTEGGRLWEIAGVVYSALTTYWALLGLLSVIDSSRSFFVAGSSYLWKDLFRMADGHSISPGMMNIIASLAPLVGLALGHRFLWLGVRQLTFLSAAVALGALALLTSEHLRTGAMPLLGCVMATKLAYGPLNTCVALIKAEAFPTQIRVSAYSLISTASKVTATLAPTLIEAWKDDESASSWQTDQLLHYLACLMSSISICGILALTVPGRSGDGRQLRDYVLKDKRRLKLSSYGSFSNIWELVSDEEEQCGQLSKGKASPKMPRVQTLPTFPTLCLPESQVQ